MQPLTNRIGNNEIENEIRTGTRTKSYQRKNMLDRDKTITNENKLIKAIIISHNKKNSIGNNK